MPGFTEEAGRPDFLNVDGVQCRRRGSGREPMIRDWLRSLRKYLLYSTAALLAVAGGAPAPNPGDRKGPPGKTRAGIQEMKAVIPADGLTAAPGGDAQTAAPR